jgi:hypothetical protein
MDRPTVNLRRPLLPRMQVGDLCAPLPTLSSAVRRVGFGGLLKHSFRPPGKAVIFDTAPESL